MRRSTSEFEGLCQNRRHIEFALCTPAMSDTLTDVAEDRTLRHWTFHGPARVKIGSEAHKQMFCRMLLETHNPYGTTDLFRRTVIVEQD